MSDEETLRKHHEEPDSEEEDKQMEESLEQEIEIRLGIVTKDTQGRNGYKPRSCLCSHHLQTDRLVGSNLFTELEINVFLRRLLGVRTEDKKHTKVPKFVKNELLLIDIGSTSTGGWILSVKEDLAKFN
ncbi:hypothetical protein BDR03DRAFT_1013308 [Suillus americanus]|nr:hypothetical protein BDR03DRAFT_1013308 [Suillus americanus]